MHNWSLKRFSQCNDLASHTTNVVCGNFIYEWRILYFNSKCFWKIFQGSFTYSQRFVEYFSYFVLISDVAFEPWPYVQRANTLPARLR